MDWFLFDNDLRHERVKTLSSVSYIASKEVAKSITSSAIAKQFGIFPRISSIFLCHTSDAVFVPKFDLLNLWKPSCIVNVVISREAESNSNCKNALFISSLQSSLLPCKTFIKSSSDGEG